MEDEENNYLQENECFRISEVYKTDYCFHSAKHKDFELHFIENGAGLKRIVGDSTEYTDNYEMILVRGNGLEHTWEKGNCESKMIREITILFSEDLLSQTLLKKDEFLHINKMFKQAEQGICFPLSAIMKIYSQIDGLPSEENPFQQFIKIVRLLHDISTCEGIRTLASSTFSSIERASDNPRVNKVKSYIQANYLEQITLGKLSSLAGMTPVSFSRFFKQQTGKNISDYIIEVRLGYAARMLLDSTKSISEICFDCGFKNLSNFNRIFKKKKGITPKIFRSHYRKDKYTA